LTRKTIPGGARVVLDPDAAKDAPDAAKDATLRAWEEARTRLVPVIGENGFRILFARSLHLTRRDFPWLSRVPTPSDQPLADLEASYERQTAEHAREANVALLVTFTSLLHALIGKALTRRLLDPAGPLSARRRGNKETEQ
jgi:hypothetical protein